MTARKVHLWRKPIGQGYWRTWCGQDMDAELWGPGRLSDVTCLRCLERRRDFAILERPIEADCTTRLEALRRKRKPTPTPTPNGD